ELAEPPGQAFPSAPASAAPASPVPSALPPAPVPSPVPSAGFGAPAGPANGGPGSAADLTGFIWGADGGSDGEVVMPSAPGFAGENRLPIFEAVESDWFRRGRNSFGWTGPADGRTGAGPGSGAWVSPADEGWRAAEVAAAPSSGGTTQAGLPRRVPQANLVPGAAPAATPAGQVPVVAAPVRSAAATRARFASFQRGAREGRAAGRDSAGPDGEDSTS
ncbi:MAG: hypothetical protein ACRDNF_00325, partial [Streptosporangiaceae bacterium]